MLDERADGETVSQPTIVLAEGGTVVRDAIAGMLRMSGYEVLAHGQHGDDKDGTPAAPISEETLATLRTGRADLCLLIAGALNGATAETVHRLRAAAPRTPVVVLSGQDDAESILSSLYAGARGFVSADADDDALLCAIEAAMSGTVVVHATNRDTLAEGLREVGYEPGACLRRRFGLTPREAQILRLLASRRTTAQIGSALFLAPKTVENNLTRIYLKLGVHSRAEAVSLCYRHGLVDPDLRSD